MSRYQWFVLTQTILWSTISNASFIEASMGTAVVNDATATYHNPAALGLLPQRQLIVLESNIFYNNHFSGQLIKTSNNVEQLGNGNLNTDYYVPSIYGATPINETVTVGLAVVANSIYSDINDHSILRYAQSSSQIQNLDFIPALSIKLNQYFVVGVGFNYSDARFVSKPITGFPSVDIPDSTSYNSTRATGYGGDAGFLIKFSKSTVLGFNYRSVVTYPFYGNSSFRGVAPIQANNYNFDFWTPARSVLTVSHFRTPDLGFIGTVQRIEWGVFDHVTFHNIATQTSNKSIILPTTIIPYKFKDTWLVTVGGIKHVNSEWTVRVAGTYDQTPGNKHYQLIHGDSLVIGTSIGYKAYKNIVIDGSYSHIFLKNQPVNINTRTDNINGIDTGSGNAVSIKLTYMPDY